MEDILIRFRLIGKDAEALGRWAARKLRSPSDQVRFLLRSELERRELMHSGERTAPDSEAPELGSDEKDNHMTGGEVDDRQQQQT